MFDFEFSVENLLELALAGIIGAFFLAVSNWAIGQLNELIELDF